ncbi:hypothetical protein Syun_020746 [Stephania yunnanensis]|uniref:Myb/SANT-like domain-containing protein n=1 Tax=Stephania yunnanensis TaxID=152371 RepID=A0AAP0NPZ5_9MAGN
MIGGLHMGYRDWGQLGIAPVELNRGCAPNPTPCGHLPSPLLQTSCLLDFRLLWLCERKFPIGGAMGTIDPDAPVSSKTQLRGALAAGAYHGVTLLDVLRGWVRGVFVEASRVGLHSYIADAIGAPNSVATKKRGQGEARCSREASHEDSTEDSKTSRRKWSHAEDVALVNDMVEMVTSGMYKCDNDFKPAYLNHLEEALKITCPNSGIKARPHIESRQKSLKKEWFIVNDMMCCIRHGTSRFDFDSTSNMVTAPDDVWEDYLKDVTRGAESTRSNRAREHGGDKSEAVADVDLSEIDTWREPRFAANQDAFEDINDVHDSNSTSEPLAAPTEEFDATPTSSRTRTTMTDASGNQAKKNRKVSNDVYIVHKLTDVERAIYGSKIMGRVELMEAFMTLQPESKLLWLHAMFN